jgi:HD superfamily phosphohydrolase
VIVRDPLWNNISLDPLAHRLVDSRAFQRLRYVRQLGLAYLVYPGATHTRFEHALGAWHLAGRTLALLEQRGAGWEALAPDARITAVAALLHDVGHYPYSHALEEIGAPHHEEVASAVLLRGEIADILREQVAPDAPERILSSTLTSPRSTAFTPRSDTSCDYTSVPGSVPHHVRRAKPPALCLRDRAGSHRRRTPHRP